MDLSSRWLSLCVLLGMPIVVSAQDMTTYYSVQHPEEFELDFANDLYRKGNRLTAQTRKLLPNHLDLSYGDHHKQQLDIYLPKNKSGKAPVLLFLHGGGFSEGDRAHYGFIAEPYSKYGIITVVASYRLSTDGFTYPAPVDDAKAIVSWIYHNIGEYDGDPGAIFVSGHSAGAIVAADIGVDRAWLSKAGISRSVLKGMALISGRYLFSEDATGLENYVPTADLKRQASPILRIEDPVPAAVIAFGEHSGDEIEERTVRPSRNMSDALVSSDVNVATVPLENQNHIDVVYSLSNPASPLFKAMIAMMEGTDQP